MLQPRINHLSGSKFNPGEYLEDQMYQNVRKPIVNVDTEQQTSDTFAKG